MKRLSLLLVMGFALITTVVCIGCSNANQAAMSAWGRPHHIKQFSGAKLIGEWDSTGKVNNEESSDGYKFQDAKTGQIVRISGHVQITVN